MDKTYILDLINESYEYINEVSKYGDLDENDKDMLQNALIALSEAEKEIEKWKEVNLKKENFTEKW